MTEEQLPEPAWMNEERIVELFLYCLGNLKVGDDGLAPGHDIGDLNACAFLCHAIKSLAIAPRDVQDILLFELADATEALIVTAVLPPEEGDSERWKKRAPKCFRASLVVYDEWDRRLGLAAAVMVYRRFCSPAGD